MDYTPLKIYKVIEFILWVFRFIRSWIRGEKLNPFNRGICDKMIIVGNGPSNASDLTVYTKAGYEVMCVNFFALKDRRFFDIKPKFYCLADGAFFENIETDSKIKGLWDVIENVDWQMTLVVLGYVRIEVNNPNIRLFRVNSNRFFGGMNLFWMKQLRNNRAMIGAQNVIVTCLYFAISSCVSNILLIGVESDVHRELYVDSNNDVFRNLVHSYGTEKVNVVECHEIDKGEIYKYFIYIAETFLEYKKMREYADYMDVSVVNLCKESFIDAFDKE